MQTKDSSRARLACCFSRCDFAALDPPVLDLHADRHPRSFSPPPQQTTGPPAAQQPNLLPEYACNAEVLLQGGSFACDFCQQDAGLFGPHLGATIADSADLWPEEIDPVTGDPIRLYDDLLVGGTAGLWLKPGETFPATGLPVDGTGEFSRAHTGTVVLHSGSVLTSPGTGSTTCLDDDAAVWRLISSDWGDLFGFSVTAIGSIDSDGFDDFIVGAPRGPFTTSHEMNEAAPWRGRVYLFLSEDFLEWDETDYDFAGPSGASNCQAGCQVCDGSVTLSNGKQSPEGCGFPNSYDAVTKASAILEADPITAGGNDRQYFGFSVARLGDFDGDGTEDFAIGAPHDDNRTTNPALVPANPGRCYIVSGHELGQAILGAGQELLTVGAGGSAVDLLVDGLTPVLCQFNGAAGNRLGHDVDGGVDMTGDGSPDLVIGAPEYRWIAWGPDIKKYSVQSTGPGAAYLVSGFDPPTSTGIQSDRLDGDWYLTASTFPNVQSGSPDYGKAFGFSVSCRVPTASTPPSSVWDFVVGAPLFSDSPAVAFSENPPGDGGPYTFPDWGPPGDALVGRSFGRATVWAWPDQAALASPPSTAEWHYRGYGSEELVGWNVKAVGNVDGVSGQEIAICSRSFSTNSRAGVGACNTPCFQELGNQQQLFDSICTTGPGGCELLTSQQLDDDAGGVSCGAVTIHRVSDGLPIREYIGEDPKDSLGWAIARMIGDNRDGQPHVVLGAGRWPGNNASRGTVANPVNSVDENGRVYVFEPQYHSGGSQ